MTDRDEPTDIELDDDVLAAANGGISASSTGGYSYNSSIYFQTSISDTIT